MKHYFIFSDVHGFYHDLVSSLNKAKFDINNPDHIIIFCGDMLDRGLQPLETYEFLRGIPKERRILIRGNHELLLRDLVKRGFPEAHDNSNGTLDTLFLLEGLGTASEFWSSFYKEQYIKHIEYGSPEYSQLREKYNKKSRDIYRGKVQEVLDWIFSNEWVNYYETKNYIFVHSFIPITQHYEVLYQMLMPKGKSSYREDWRNATNYEWEDAMWGCPWKQAKYKLNQTGKTIVCGHWHTSDFFNNLTKQHKDLYDCPVFKSKRYKLIGLDACTVVSHEVNILVMGEEDL